MPMLDNNSAEPVDIFSVFMPSPPVPHVSTQSLTLTLLDLFLKTETPPAISSETSPFADRRVKKSNISLSEALPSINILKADLLSLKDKFSFFFSFSRYFSINFYNL